MTHAPSENASPLHAQLRAATKQPHHALDHHPLLAALLRAPRCEDYARALAALHGVYAATEAAILAFFTTHPGLFDYSARCKLPALEADLRILGHTPFAARAAPASPTTLGAVIGMLYIIEGSTRGGQYLHRQLQQHFGASVPLSFFAGYRAESEQRWQEFWAFADAHCAAEEIPAAVASAIACFDFIKAHLDHCSKSG